MYVDFRDGVGTIFHHFSLEECHLYDLRPFKINLSLLRYNKFVNHGTNLSCRLY